jgi:hypothetical protein
MLQFFVFVCIRDNLKAELSIGTVGAYLVELKW